MTSGVLVFTASSDAILYVLTVAIVTLIIEREVWLTIAWKNTGMYKN